MTYEEAYAELKDIYINVLEYRDIRTQRAFEMAIEALKKQTPKKALRKDTEKPCLYCPNCGAELWIENHHCKCGQKISWDI